MGSSNKIVKGVFWTTALNIVNAVYGFVAVPILINHFGKSEYGLIGLAMSVNVYMRLMDMGFNSTNVRFFSAWLSEKKNAKVSKAFETSLTLYGVIGLLNGVVLLGVSFFSEQIFNVTQEQAEILKKLFYILAFSAFCNWFSSCFDQLIKATENVDWIQRRQLIPKCLQILILLATVCFSFSIELYYLLTCLAVLSIIPMSIIKIRKEVPLISFIPGFDKDIFKEMLPYSLNIFSFGIFQFSFYNLRPVFLGMQGTIESVTDFRVLNGIIGVVHMLGGTFIPILLPSTAKVLARKEKEAYYRMAYDGTKYISIILCFCTFGMMSIGPDAITLYVGNDYLELIPWFNLWLLCNLTTHNQAISSLILAGSDIRAISYCSFISSVIGLLVTWVTIPIYQVGGVVIGYFIYGSIQLCFFYMYYWPRTMKINSIKVLCYSFGPYLCIGSICYATVRLFPRNDNCWLNLFLFGAIFFMLYLTMSYLTLNDRDKSFCLSLIKKKL